MFLHPVVEEIKRRLQGDSTAGEQGTKLALVIGGGAMRGIVSMGMLAALEEMGANDIFDAVYGSSAGAANGASFLAHQCASHVHAYVHDLASRRFVQIRKNGVYVDVEYAREIMAGKYALDVDAVKGHRTKLCIAATDIMTGTCAWFHNHDGAIDVMDALMASSAMPAFYNKPVRIRQGYYLDGGTVAPLPILQAISEGATHVLVLSTLPRHYRKKNMNWVLERILRKKISMHGEAFNRVFQKRHEAYNDALDAAFGRKALPASVQLLTLAPERTLSWSEMRKKRLQKAWKDVYDKTMKEITI